MGRNAGFLALEGGECCGAYIILIPEHDFSVDKVNGLVLEGQRAGLRYNILLAAEGAKPEGGSEVLAGDEVDSFGHKTLGGVGEFLARQIKEGLGLDTRSVVLSHLQRGGAPSAYDRRMGRYFGIAAIDLVAQERFGRLVSLTNGQIVSLPLVVVTEPPRTVNVETEYDRDRYNGRRTIIHGDGEAA
jgi:6-phosphofructokinase